MKYHSKKSKKRFSAALRRLLPGKAREHIQQFHIEQGAKIVIACRVSTGPQESRSNLDGQEQFLRREVESRGGIVVGVSKVAASGFDPIWLMDAVRLARKSKAAILTESTDRFIRHPAYHSKTDPELQARDPDLSYLSYLASGVRLMTYLDPEATPGEVRGHQTRRGQFSKNRFGGRKKKKSPGYLKRRRKRLLPVVLKQLDQ